MKITQISLALFAVAVAGCGSKTPATPTAPVATNSVGDPITMTTPPPGVQKPVPTATLMNARDMKPDNTTYRVRGQVKGVEKSAPDGRMTLIVSHEDIPGFMPAMEMRLPFKNNADAGKVKVGDKIAFDMNRSNLDVSKVEKLPPATQLKLKK